MFEGLANGLIDDNLTTTARVKRANYSFCHLALHIFNNPVKLLMLILSVLIELGG